MIKELSSIAEVKQGYSLRKGLDTNPEQGSVRVVKAKDVNNLEIDINEVEYANLENMDDHYLQKGDILLRTRTPIQASIYNSDEKAIALSPIVRIRLTDQSVSPQYLLWYFVSQEAQNYLEENMTGTVMQGISVSQLKSMPINLLSAEKMNAVVDIFATFNEYKHKVQNLLQLKEEEMHTKLNTLLGANNG